MTPAVKPKLKKTLKGKWTAHVALCGRKIRSTRSSAEGAAAACMQKALGVAMTELGRVRKDCGSLSDGLQEVEAQLSTIKREHEAAVTGMYRKHQADIADFRKREDIANIDARMWRQRYEAQRSHGQHLEAVLAKHGVVVQSVGVYNEPSV